MSFALSRAHIKRLRDAERLAITLSARAPQGDECGEVRVSLFDEQGYLRDFLVPRVQPGTNFDDAVTDCVRAVRGQLSLAHWRLAGVPTAPRGNTITGGIAAHR